MSISLQTAPNVSGIVSQWLQQSAVNSITTWASSLSGIGLIIVGMILLLAGRKVIDAATLLISVAMILIGLLSLFGINVLKVIGI